MRLDDQLDAAEVGRRPVRRTLQQFSQREYAGRDLSDPRILRQQLGRVAAPNREAGGFQADYRRSRARRSGCRMSSAVRSCRRAPSS